MELLERNRQVIEEFRANARKAGGPVEGRRMLLLTTTGAKSGQPRTSPVAYVSDGERLVVVGSNGGTEIHPNWYHNLLAHPQVTVEVGSETFDATAVVAQGEERQRLWAKVVAAQPFFGEYQAKIKRQIPVIALSRRPGKP